MTAKSLLVMVPTRGRRARAEQCLKSFTETVSLDTTEIMFITDGDDQDTYDGMDWGVAHHAVIDPRQYVVSKLNTTAMGFADDFDVLMHTGDDNVFVTEGWDRLMLDRLEEMGGTGWVYPENRRRNDVPEMWLCSSDVVKALGWFLNPALNHFYVDNTVAELGKRSGLIRWCPQAVIEHQHYSISPGVDRDETYRTTEETFGTADFAAYHEWKSTQMGNEVAVLRRLFSPDVAWVLSRVA
jgi:hypothetical protein